MASCARLTKVMNPDVIRVVYLSGQVDEFPAPVSAKQVLQDHPRHFIFNSRDLFGSSCPPLQPEDELRLGELYFLLPLSALQSAENLVALAAKLYAAAKKKASRRAQPRRSSDLKSDLPGERLAQMGDDTEVKMTLREQPISKSRSWRPSLQTIEETDFAR